MAILVALGSFAIAANFSREGLLLFWLSFGVIAVSVILLGLLTTSANDRLARLTAWKSALEAGQLRRSST